MLGLGEEFELGELLQDELDLRVQFPGLGVVARVLLQGTQEVHGRPASGQLLGLREQGRLGSILFYNEAL